MQKNSYVSSGTFSTYEGFLWAMKTKLQMMVRSLALGSL